MPVVCSTKGFPEKNFISLVAELDEVSDVSVSGVTSLELFGKTPLASSPNTTFA